MKYFRTKPIVGIIDDKTLITNIYQLSKKGKSSKNNKYNEMIKLFNFLASNNRWMDCSNEKYNNLREAVCEVIKINSWHRVFYDLLKIIPIKLCRGCACNTSEEQTMCDKCIHKEILLTKLLPYELVRKITLIAGPNDHTHDPDLFIKYNDKD